ncbi:MAG TPA: choice-of-anchor tandem repeat GloVer-containing protein, partial [Candidatus Sulfotelmatobacter sp.]
MSRISTQRLNVRLALAAIAIVFLMAASVSAQTYSTLFTYPIDTRNDSGIFTPGIMSQGQDGNIYGTIVDDGSNGDGSAFKMTTSGEFTRIYAFCQLTGCVDGASPYGGLTLGRDGNLYGGAEVGGKNAFGTLFKLTPTGTLTTIWDFKGGTDTGYPLYPPFQGTDGNFYAAPNGSNGAGAVIKLTPTKAPPYLEKTLGNFIGTNGGAPAFPVQATDGNFYGAAFNGGSRGFGVVYKATPAGKLTVLHNFCTQTSCLDGASPIGALVQGEDGALYGVTYQGGAGNIGIFFKITTAGTFTLLHSFAGFSGSEPALPRSGLIVGSDGNFYGVTYA